MHETSIALSILKSVEEVYNNTPGAIRVTRITVSVGILSLVDPEALVFALKVASRGTPMENAEIVLENKEPVFYCRRCGSTWSLTREDMKRFLSDENLMITLHYYPDKILEYMKCPKCGSSDVEIIEGRGVVVESVELEVEE